MSKVQINCERKSLPEFPRSISKNTELMRMSGNLIAKIPDNFYLNWPNVSTLSLERNRIIVLQDEAFKNLKHLTEVFISENRIQSVGSRLFAGTAPNVEIAFMLGNNQIDKIADNVFQDSPSNFRVHLNSNRIRILTPGVFKSAEGVQYLGLANNNISSVQSGAFLGLHRVETLSLEENLFSDLPIDAIRMLPGFVKVKLQKNPIICTCKLRSLRDDTTTITKIVDFHLIKCSNADMTVKQAMTSMNCTSTTSNPSLKTDATPTNKTHGKIAHVSHSTPASGLKNKSQHDQTTRSPMITVKKQEYDKQPHLPLVIGATTGAIIIVIVIVLFTYLYRRPIAARATTTLSLTRRRKNPKSSAYIYHYPPKANNEYTVDYNI
eukprot:gene8875-9825_t